jgi:hypothetical protein
MCLFEVPAEFLDQIRGVNKFDIPNETPEIGKPEDDYSYYKNTENGIKNSSASTADFFDQIRVVNKFNIANETPERSNSENDYSNYKNTENAVKKSCASTADFFPPKKK